MDMVILPVLREMFLRPLHIPRAIGIGDDIAMATKELRLQRGIQRGTAFEITIDAEPFTAYPGETLATVLLAAGHSTFRFSPISQEPRGLFCGMGHCFDCLVTVNERPNVRACVTPAQPGDAVEIQRAESN
jgi:hypothetical protein